MRVEPLELASLEPYLEHMARQMAESGLHGLPIFNPLSRDEKIDMERLRSTRGVHLTLPVGQPGWRRVWAAWDDGRVVGGTELSGGSIDSVMHRALFTIGVERSHHRRGLATRLATHAIDWARAQPVLDWIDLGVFAHNTVAVALYERLGFERQGVVADRFRVDGQVIDDIQMALHL